jgi:hypothetical protein
MAENIEIISIEEGIEFGSDKKVDEYGLIDDGVYEVVLDKIETKVSKSNNKYLNVTFKIRDDVDQNFKTRRIWHTIFSRDNDKAFNFNAINEIIVTQEGRPDYKRHFKSFDEILQYLIGLHLTLRIGTEFDQFKGEDANIIEKGSFGPSEWDKTHPSANAQPAPVGNDGAKGGNLDQLDDVVSDDLPF